MEDLSHLTLGKKKGMSLAKKRRKIKQKQNVKKTCKRKEKKEKEKKKIQKSKKINKNKKNKKRKRERRRKKNTTYSLPSLREIQRPQERWIGAHWESQEANPLPSYRPFGFSPHYRLPAF